MKQIDFNDLWTIMSTQGLDLYNIKLPKLKIDNELGGQLRRHFLLLNCLRSGLPEDQAIAAVASDTGVDFSRHNTGRYFNFWHFVLDLMQKNAKAKYPQVGKCVIKRGMVDPNQSEDLIQVFCYPYIAQGGKFAAPVIDRILDYFEVDSLQITAKLGD